jgi:hypothetical protein
MKLRAKANDNIIERDGEEAEALIAGGLYEKVEEAETDEQPANRKRAQYKRRDMKAE